MAKSGNNYRTRRSFAKIPEIADAPYLLSIQSESFDWLIKDGLTEVFKDVFPIEDFTGNLKIDFVSHQFGDSKYSVDECKEKDMTYSCPLFGTTRFVNKETGEVKEQTVFMGDFPMMTDKGTFIINGTERVVVTQLVRSPGAYLMEP
ncbi:MAG: DNA-directed RNA polymerase subunit beta, partial [Terriglobia bacterium]